MASKLKYGKIKLEDIGPIYEQNKDKIFRLGLRLLGTIEDAMDLVQDTFKVVLERYEKFRGDSSVSTWVFRIAMNGAFQRLRGEPGARSKKGKIPIIGLDDIINELMVDPDQEDIVITNELVEKTTESFMGLCEGCQTILFLYFYEEKRGKELEEILSMSSQRVSEKIKECLSNLKSKLEVTKIIRKPT